MKTDDRNTAVANLGICYSRLGIYEEAIELLVKSLELGLTIDWEGQAHCQLGIAYVHLSRLDEAKKELQFCEENAAKYQLPLSVVYGWLYRVCRGLGQTEEAEHYHRLGKPV
jgi:tetratricopeptide (TPR) repeat protein